MHPESASRELQWAHKQWSWMGISLDNGDRISLWDIIDGDKEHAFATLLHLNGRHEHPDKRRDRPSLSNPLVHPTSFRRERDRDLKRSVGPCTSSAEGTVT